MKKLLVVLSLAVTASLFIYQKAEATSGACSYHGGVNCSAGRDWDGSVICYDGWTGSSVSYDSMVMCSSYSNPYYSTPSCPTMSYYDSLSGSCKCYSGYIVDEDIFGNEACVSANSYCHDELGYHSSYSSLYNRCECDYGYILYGGQCTSPEDRCTDLYGYGSRYNILQEMCECKSGYKFNGSRCELDFSGYYSFPSYTPPSYTPAPTTTCPANSTLNTDGSCYCNTGYTVSSDKTACVVKLCPVNAALIGSSCYCNVGYQWDSTQTTCQATQTPTQATPSTDVSSERNLSVPATINQEKSLPLATAGAACQSGSLIKGTTAAVYYCGGDGKRYVFPNDRTYFTWYDDFDSVITINDTELANLPIGGNVTYRPGGRMIKITTSPSVYAIETGGVLREVTSEETATRLYGADWSKLVDDIPDAFFTNYRIGAPIP